MNEEENGFRPPRVRILVKSHVLFVAGLVLAHVPFHAAHRRAPLVQVFPRAARRRERGHLASMISRVSIRCRNVVAFIPEHQRAVPDDRRTVRFGHRQSAAGADADPGSQSG
ncbi:hypothetical protein E1161_04940 [Saccharopolyspora aridisoli]|uniref:Uncharacterized protein n=1 Tax=Saccharopolyspora aridisoli TaxID=2530385 RepID=A0A4R4UTW6_9PSEU|nr:hypothetical protein [Saccharopolyspora aridisoli]TDC95521.1 hypothetical protein E1161_04940 [Saccharopolyspora aridisoli]